MPSAGQVSAGADVRGAAARLAELRGQAAAGVAKGRYLRPGRGVVGHGIAYPASIGAADAPLAIGAAGVVLEYLKTNQARVGPESLTVRTYSPDATMPLDIATIRNLEIGALVTLIDHTATAVGARRLREWLGAPLRDAESIELRLAAVAELTSNPTLREAIHVAMNGVGDLERLSARATHGRAGLRELIALRRSLEALPGVQQAVAACESLVVREHAGEITPAPGLAEVLRAAVVEEPPASREGGAIKPG